MQVEQLYRRTWAQINLDAVAHNFREIRKATKAKICCVIKADAYGHGAVRLAQEYETLGADYFGVSNIDEALQLRRGGITRPLLIFGFTPVTAAPVLAQNGISQCVYSAEYGATLSAAATAAGVTLKVHVKIDTGMSRLGFYYQDPQRDEHAIGEVATVCTLPGLKAEGIFTHFAVSDMTGENVTFTERQIAAFTQLCETLADMGHNFLYRHCANSGAVLDYPQAHFDMVRAGIILYGLTPSSEVRNSLHLQPALALKSVVSHVKTILPGAAVSYGRHFVAQAPMCVATVPIGYADGYSRVLSQAGATVLIHGKRCKILGKICMDQLMVDLGDLRNVAIGDIVTVIGCDGDEQITAEEVAALRDTINYEVVCDIGARVPRVYEKAGREVGVLNYIGT